MQKEKDVLALLSRLDLENVSFTQSPPGNALAINRDIPRFVFVSRNFIYIMVILVRWLWAMFYHKWISGDASQSVHLVASEGLEAYLPLADMVDISAEMQRLSKRLAKMQTEYDGLMARLSSPSVSSRRWLFCVFLSYFLDLHMIVLTSTNFMR